MSGYPLAEDELDGLRRLNAADEARQICPARRLRRNSELRREAAARDKGSDSRALGGANTDAWPSKRKMLP